MLYLYIHTEGFEKPFIMDAKGPGLTPYYEPHDYTKPVTANGYVVCELPTQDPNIKLEGRALWGRFVEEIFDIIPLNDILAGCRLFQQKEAEVAVSKASEQYLSQFSKADAYIWQIQEQEAEKYNSIKGYSSEILNSIAKSKNIKVEELVSKILGKSYKHKMKLLSFNIFLTHFNNKMGSFTTIEEFANLRAYTELEKFTSEFIPTGSRKKVPKLEQQQEQKN